MGLRYAGSCIYFHPSHQLNSHFRYIGRDTNIRRAHVIAFAQKPESEDYLAQSHVPGSAVPIRFLVEGFVWVDPNNYQVLRMYTKMLLPETATSLRATNSLISYEKVRFDNKSVDFWLPKEAVVDWEFQKLAYVSRHKYSDYHLFSVESDYKITQPKIDK